MKSKCPSWRGEGACPSAPSRAPVLAFTEAKRKPFYEKGRSGQAPFSRLFARKSDAKALLS